MRSKYKQTWLTISLINLSLVAMLGFLLRSKILFSIPFVNFKYTLHAHSHFAFGGWVSLALITLMISEILPKADAGKKIYQWLLSAFFLSAAGMLVTFLMQGYGPLSIFFSTLFIFVSYAFAGVFTKHTARSSASTPVKILSIGAVIYLSISSVGPFTLAYLLASKSDNVVLYKDSIYTYLHLQYNGFFTLAVFALLINRIENLLPNKTFKTLRNFSRMLTLSVIPSLFLCFLWHYPNAFFMTIAYTGSITMLLSLVYFLKIARESTPALQHTNAVVKYIGGLSLAAFCLKMFLQSLTVFHPVGDLVFNNRPVIIGFLHLVLLGFVTLYILSHLIHSGILKYNQYTTFAVITFSGGLILNEVTLMLQGVGIMLMKSSAAFPWLLWIAAIELFTGSILIVVARLISIKVKRPKQMDPATELYHYL